MESWFRKRLVGNQFVFSQRQDLRAVSGSTYDSPLCGLACAQRSEILGAAKIVSIYQLRVPVP